MLFQALLLVVVIATASSTQSVISKPGSAVRLLFRPVDTCHVGGKSYRIRCGYREKYRHACSLRGCCWDETVSDAPQCFFRVPRSHSALSMMMPMFRSSYLPELNCNIENPQDRISCGAVDESICRAKGCCWDASAYGAPSCFYAAPSPCLPGEFRCWPDICISACVACDGYNDCIDNFDESPEFCGTWECPEGFVRCSGSQQCVRDYLFCNNEENCALGSDEDIGYCATRECPKGYKRCYGSDQCVLDYYFDDGYNDCNIGTDESAEYLALNPTGTK